MGNAGNNRRAPPQGGATILRDRHSNGWSSFTRSYSVRWRTQRITSRGNRTVCRSRRQVHDDDVPVTDGGQRTAAEVDRALDIPGQDRVTAAVDGDRIGEIFARSTETL